MEGTWRDCRGAVSSEDLMRIGQRPREKEAGWKTAAPWIWKKIVHTQPGRKSWLLTGMQKPLEDWPPVMKQQTLELLSAEICLRWWPSVEKTNDGAVDPGDKQFMAYYNWSFHHTIGGIQQCLLQSLELQQCCLTTIETFKLSGSSLNRKVNN